MKSELRPIVTLNIFKCVMSATFICFSSECRDNGNLFGGQRKFQQMDSNNYGLIRNKKMTCVGSKSTKF